MEVPSDYLTRTWKVLPRCRSSQRFALCAIYQQELSPFRNKVKSGWACNLPTSTIHQTEKKDKPRQEMGVVPIFGVEVCALLDQHFDHL
eukprot:519710-Rhodomonas_salina.2